MWVVTKRRLLEYWTRHPDARNWLENWHKIACETRWKGFADVRRTFPHADMVKVGSGNSVAVFNVCGNKHRMIAAIHYNSGKVFVLRLMPHAEYSRDQWKERL
jgi:mRNA interferase HigB